MSVPPQIGRYRILGELGRGAMGTVYRGRDEALERDVAIKVMSVRGADADARARFSKEGRAAARLQHPNIVTIYELGEHQGAPYMALELLEGMDLQQAIEAGIRPDPRVTLPIVLQALAGLGHAHEHGIVHRDVKPSNVFLPRGRPAKIMDFGIARLADGPTTRKMLVGTPNYMSPEQVRTGDLDGRSDLFSVGLILYELVTGEKAYRGDTVVAVLYKITNERPDLGLLPPGPRWEKLRAIITRALQRKAEDRYPDARAMSADIEEALRDLGWSGDWRTASDQAVLARPRPGGRPPGAPTPTPAAPLAVVYPSDASEVRTPSEKRARTHIALAAAVGLTGLVLLGTAVLMTMRRSEKPGPAAVTTPAATLPATTLARPTPTPSSAPPVSVTLPAPAPPPATSLAASMTTPVASSPVPAVAPAEARLERANALMDSGRFAQALAEAKAVLAREPGNAAARELAQDAEAAILVEEAIRKARLALKGGDRDAALVEIRRGLAVNPSEGRLLALFREATQ
jgi:serine/threonine-protein kinase